MVADEVMTRRSPSRQELLGDFARRAPPAPIHPPKVRLAPKVASSNRFVHRWSISVHACKASFALDLYRQRVRERFSQRVFATRERCLRFRVSHAWSLEDALRSVGLSELRSRIRMQSSMQRDWDAYPPSQPVSRSFTGQEAAAVIEFAR